MGSLHKAGGIWAWLQNVAARLDRRQRIVQRAERAAAEMPEPIGTPAALFADGEVLNLKGHEWRVAKRVGGPLPVILLEPIGLTRRAKRRVLSHLRRNRRSA